MYLQSLPLFHTRGGRLMTQVSRRLKDTEVAAALIWRGWYYGLNMFSEVRLLET